MIKIFPCISVFFGIASGWLAEASNNVADAPLSVAVIGCGPSAMSLMHALQLRKEKLDPNSSEFKTLPEIICYEQAEGPGGIWRALPENDRERNRPGSSILMYEDLWLNGPKEVMEYFDYTFDDHFQQKTPAYIPRQDVFEYVLARNSRNGALDNAQYNHTVLNVSYNPSSTDFSVMVRNDNTNETTTKRFDRCVWACGQNGEPYKPAEILALLERGNVDTPSGGFHGTYYHAVEATERFEGDVKGKKIMLIGDNSSAEDLALRAIKYGVEHVYIISRSGTGDASQTGSWPVGKVTFIRGVPKQVCKGNVFLFWNDDDEDDKEYDSDDDDFEWDPEVITIKDISTVVLCTGYKRNMEMLDEELRHDPDMTWSTSEDWVMNDNLLTESIGHVTPSQQITRGFINYPDLYNGLLISNPNMMYLIGPKIDDAPIFSLDLYAWVILAYLTGDVDIPNHEGMVKANQELLEAEMQIHESRFLMDSEYRAIVRNLPDSHWIHGSDSDERSLANQMEFAFYEVGSFARYMRISNYPFDFGEQSKLNAIGKRFAEIIKDSGLVRYSLKQNPSVGSKGLTFRDTHRSSFVSVHTNTSSLPFPAHWVDLRADKGVPTKIQNLRDFSMPQNGVGGLFELNSNTTITSNGEYKNDAIAK